MRVREPGFTLLELMLILVVMCLVAVVTYPSMLRGRTAFHLRAVGRDVVNALRFARETAVAEQKVMIVSVDFESQKITVADDVGDGARSFAPPSDVKIQRLASSSGELQQGPLRIRFLPNGSSDDAEILLKSDSGATLKIVADPIRGAARIVSEQGEKGP
jgi:type II secretion system protein H